MAWMTCNSVMCVKVRWAMYVSYSPKCSNGTDVGVEGEGDDAVYVEVWRTRCGVPRGCHQCHDKERQKGLFPASGEASGKVGIPTRVHSPQEVEHAHSH